MSMNPPRVVASCATCMLSLAANQEQPPPQPVETVEVAETNGSYSGDLDEQTILRNRAKMFGGRKKTPKSP